MKTIIKLLSLTAVALVTLTLQTAKADWLQYHPSGCTAFVAEHEQYLYYDVNGLGNTADFPIWVVCPTGRPNTAASIDVEAHMYHQVVTATTCAGTITTAGYEPWGVVAIEGATTAFADGDQSMHIPSIGGLGGASNGDMVSIYCALGPKAILKSVFIKDSTYTTN